MKRMLRAGVVLALWALVPPVVRPCGPYYNDAHHRLPDPLAMSFFRFYRELYEPCPDWRVAHQRFNRFYADFRADYVADPTCAAVKWEAFSRRGLLNLEQLRELRDDLDLIAAGLDLYDPAVFEYRNLRGHRLVPDLCELAADAEPPLRVFILTTLARCHLWRRHLDLEEAGALLAPELDGPAKADERAYLRAYQGLAAHLLEDGEVDAGRVAADLTAYANAFPRGRWRGEVIGWRAYLLFHGLHDRDHETDAVHRERFFRAIRLYQGLLDEPAFGAMRPAAIDSLRAAYHRLEEEDRSPPPELFPDPRHALAYLYFRFRPARRPEAVRADREAGRLGEICRRARGVLAGIDPTDFPPIVLTRFAHAFHRAGMDGEARALVERAMAVAPEPELRYLAGRLALAAGEPETAEEHLAALLAEPGRTDRVRNLGMRLGEAWERRSDWSRALGAYGRVDAVWDWHILVDGEMPVAALRRFVAEHESLTVAVGRQPDAHREGRDILPEIATALGVRLVRAGAYAEAVRHLRGRRLRHLETLVHLEGACEEAGPSERPARLYALAAHWYHHGRHLVFFSRVWHQWCHRRAEREEGRLVLDSDREANLLAMSVYPRAREFFERIYADHPDSPEAPKALYSAACCWFWQIRSPFMSSSWYWEGRDRREDFWARGVALLRRLRNEYPDHPLSHSAWLRKHVGEE